MPKLEDMMFINKRSIQLYLNLERYSLHAASSSIGMTYANANKLLKNWAKQGLVYLTKTGRRYNIVYTPKGKRLAIAFSELQKIMREESIQYD